MTLYVTEREMIDRYVDSLKRSSSRALELLRAESVARPKLFVEFIDGLKIAAGSAHQLFHSQQRPEWLRIRDILEKIIEVGQETPPQSMKQNGLWFQIKVSLDEMVDRGRSLVITKAPSRDDVLVELAIREQRKKEKINNDKTT